jgi:hypothetical protein
LEQKGRLTLKESAAIGKTIKSDIGGGFLRSAPLRAYQWLATARELSRKITPVTGTRTLDVLHLALVKSERCTHVASFDANQRRAARLTTARHRRRASILDNGSRANHGLHRLHGSSQKRKISTTRSIHQMVSGMFSVRLCYPCPSV